VLKNDHSLIHAGKVCLFSALIGKRLGLNEEDTLSLMAAAIFHDIGRINNSDDAAHGDRSAKKLREYGFDIPETVETIIRLHSRGDRLSKEERLTRIFKDADALDRMRTNDLNIQFLRFIETKDYINFAKEVNACLSKLIG
jgi:putative nucleotidyltransferase with HDIG domain